MSLTLDFKRRDRVRVSNLLWANGARRKTLSANTGSPPILGVNMDAMEQIENQLEERKQISESLGFMDLQHYEEFKESAANGMIRFGDSFIQVLGTALAIADGKNARKIMRY